MSDDISDIGAFYDNDPQREDRRLEQHQLEYDLTWRYLTQYLPEQGTILEVGAATGRYTVELAQRGYTVVAVDLSAGLLEVCKRRLAEAGLEKHVKLAVADARDLSAVTETDFDAVLLMGPLYHLIDESDRRTALQQATDRLRAGGVLFSAMLSRFGVMGDLLNNNPGWIETQAEVQSVLAHGKRPDDFPRGGFRGYLARVDEVVPLHESLGFQTLTLAGVEPLIGANDASYNQLEGSRRTQWLDVLYAISAEPSILGSSRHLLYIGQKRIG
ncbi:MAG: class I SAM-dependent methyltransferase [Anaerolineae bacterium]